MIRRIILLLLAVFLFGGSASVLAQEEPAETPDLFPRVVNRSRHAAAIRVHGLLNDINQRRVKSAEGLVIKLQGVLDRIADVAAKRAEHGDDMSVMREAIAEARTALDAARSAIRDQSERTYVFDDATDRTISDRLRAVRDELSEDLSTVRVLIREAIQAVRNAARAVRAVS